MDYLTAVLLSLKMKRDGGGGSGVWGTVTGAASWAWLIRYCCQILFQNEWSQNFKLLWEKKCKRTKYINTIFFCQQLKLYSMLVLFQRENYGLILDGFLPCTREHALQGSRTFGLPVAALLPAAVGGAGELLCSGFKFLCVPPWLSPLAAASNAPGSFAAGNRDGMLAIQVWLITAELLELEVHHTPPRWGTEWCAALLSTVPASPISSKTPVVSRFSPAPLLLLTTPLHWWRLLEGNDNPLGRGWLLPLLPSCCIVSSLILPSTSCLHWPPSDQRRPSTLPRLWLAVAPPPSLGLLFPCLRTALLFMLLEGPSGCWSSSPRPLLLRSGPYPQPGPRHFFPSVIFQTIIIFWFNCAKTLRNTGTNLKLRQKHEHVSE